MRKKSRGRRSWAASGGGGEGEGGVCESCRDESSAAHCDLFPRGERSVAGQQHGIRTAGCHRLGARSGVIFWGRNGRGGVGFWDLT